ncbi:hypothetical protein ABIE59_001292 [Marinobacter sp. MBR-99]|jgi:hypothetical protein|uniref:hypothetical protein n=1 Tax=Marinobacter sp. MBR-99 TaxID=3156461 RepID=UPI0033971AB2
MDPVSSINQVIQTLRQRLSERAPAASGGKASKAQGPAAGRSTRLSKTDIQRKIAEAIKSASSDDEQHRAEIFVENILTWQLGEDIVNDPKFTEMTKEVVATIALDQHQWQQLQNYLDHLN